MYARTCAFEGPLGSPRRAIQPSSREKTAHDLRVGELQWPPEDGENVTNRTVNAPGYYDGIKGVVLGSVILLLAITIGRISDKPAQQRQI